MRRTIPVRVIVVVVLAAVLGALALSCGKTPPRASRYHCPMHPTYTAERPGDCPICGMRLVPFEEAPGPAAHPTDPPATGHAAYTCPMHPEVTSGEPGRCPDCGMPLVATGQTSTPRPADHPERAAASDGAPRTGRTIIHYRSPMDPSVTSPVPAKDSMGMDFLPVYGEGSGETATAGLPGHAAIELGPDQLRLAGVQTAPATRSPLARSLRAVGIVTADEARIHHVHTKIPGWVEKLFVGSTGQLVRTGEPILTIYSRELLASQEEYLRAREAAGRFSLSELPEVRRGGEDLVRAARRRLELFDVPEAFIAQLERTGTVSRAVTLEAPASGFVATKDVFAGQQVEPALELFTIVDLSHVWVEADFYEYEAKVLRLGSEAVIGLPFDTGTRLRGRIAFISPTLDTNTRTLKVRFELPNPGMALRPGMFANVELEAEPGDGIVVPDSALIDTGERQIVFVAIGGGVFEPREVRVGGRSGGMVQILSGVAAGEPVVVRANFLLDSESRLRAALAAPPPTPGSEVRGPGAGEASHAH